jgi:hypothetical protein
MASVNTYVSAKVVTQIPNEVTPIAYGDQDNGIPWVAALDPNEHYPALLIKSVYGSGKSNQHALVTLRLDLARLVKSLLAAEAAEQDRWEPVRPGDREGWYGNSILSCHVQKHEGGVVQISYHRHDRAPIRDWRYLQRLKNQLLGPEWEGVEIYPAESRLVDTSNEYHGWFIDGPLPLGFDYRDVATQDQLDDTPVAQGAVQRDDPGVDTSGYDRTQTGAAKVRTPIWEAEGA